LKKKLKHDSACMEFRRLTINDYKALIKLWSRAGLSFEPKGRDSEGSIARQMQANPEFFLRRGARIFCALIDDFNEDASKKLFRECGYVEHRGKIYFSRRDSDEGLALLSAHN